MQIYFHNYMTLIVKLPIIIIIIIIIMVLYHNIYHYGNKPINYLIICYHNEHNTRTQ